MSRSIHSEGNEGVAWSISSRSKGVSKKQVQSVLEITKFMKFPPGLYALVISTFKCNISLGMITPPVIFARCCKNVLGCEACVNELYTGDEGMRKRCPLCSSERALSETCRINGLNDFLIGLSPLFEQGSLSPMMVPPAPHNESDDNYNFP